MSGVRGLVALASVAVGIGAFGGAALGQAEDAAIFVTNNGNLEGSVTSFSVNPDGTPTLVQFLVLSEDGNDPGNNANAVSLSPNGRWLAIAHAAGGTSPVRQLTMLEVNGDATLSLVGEFSSPATALDIEWVDDTYLAVLESSLDVTNKVLVYEFVPGPPASFTLVGQQATSDFTTGLAKHPTERVLYAGNTFGGNAIFTVAVDGSGNASLLDTLATSASPLSPEITNGGDYLYAFGGISSGGNAVLGFRIESDFTPTTLGGSPYTSPGASPKDAAFSDDDGLIFVGHGTDSTIRSFAIDAETGDIASTGFSFDIGLQGTLGDMQVLNGVLYATDDSLAIDGEAGLVTLSFTSEGEMTKVGPTVGTLGVTPTEIAVWPGLDIPCPGDTNGDGQVTALDISTVLSNFGATGVSGPSGGDVDGDGDVTALDISFVLSAFGSTCG